MGRIRALSRDIIGKIAAGEVVERPAAAIKELVENSLDAGATAVFVEIREGGTELIRVSDNGSGINEADIRLAFERHATSKISRETDLDAIGTLGFRGEALASIAAVSRVTMTTRTADRETGLRVQNDGGVITDIQEAACPVGTTFVIRELFYNTPVRRGFLKKASAETAAVTELMSRMILSRPDVSFRYVTDGKTIWHSPGDGRLQSAVFTVFGGQALKNMRLIHGNASGLLADGFVGIGELARGNRNQEIFFINRRIMRSEILSQAVETACRERVMIGKYPMCVLNITLPYEAVDVNVHPNKLEVRFRDEAAVKEGLMVLVLEGLRDQDAFEKPVEMRLNPPEDRRNGIPAENGAAEPVKTEIPKAVPTVVTTAEKVPSLPETGTAEKPQPVFRDAEKDAGSEEREPEPAVPVTDQAGRFTAEQPEPVLRETNRVAGFTARPIDEKYISAELAPDLLPADAPLPEQISVSITEERAEQVSTILQEQPEPLRIFGALFNTYILIEYQDALLLVDQHAVHERLNFDRMMAAFGKEGAGQELLVPMILSVTKKEMALLEENRELLEQIGLVTEPFGETDVAVRTIPMLLGETQAAAFVREILGELEAGRMPGWEKKRTMLLQSACKHAVKGGERLPESVIRGLVEEMIEKKVTPTCPHGRPLVVSISHRELDRKFKRIQN